MDEINGIDEESERNADISIEGVPEDWFEKLMQKQRQADYRCPRCGYMSAEIGVCPRCRTQWTPPLYD